MINKIKRFLLNTPKKYWSIAFHYHLHKAFWGVLFVIIGIIIIKTFFIWGILSLIFGVIMLTLSVVGNIYKKDKPYLRLWDKYKK